MDNTFDNTRVYVKDKSEEIQEKLFSLGYKWGNIGKTVSDFNFSFLYIDKSKLLYSGYNNRKFIENTDYKEVTIEDILNYEPKIKVKLEPFQKVLVRDYESEIWHLDIFSDIRNNRFICFRSTWKYCIPYEGNEHLFNTSTSSNIEIINN